MADNKAVKGLGLLAMIGLFFVKTCKSSEHEFGTIFREIPKIFSHEKVKPYVFEDIPLERKTVHADGPSTPEPKGDKLRQKISSDEILSPDEAKKKEDANRSKGFKQNLNGSYDYDNKPYIKFDKIPFQSNDNIHLNRAITPDEAAYLIEKGVKFVFNESAYLKQKDKPFKVIYLISNDVSLVKKLYELDESNAKALINFSNKLPENESILKVSSYEEMLAIEKEVLGNNEVPILVFHNSVKQRTLNRFDSESNFITCNSFELNPESYLTSVDLLDMSAIIEGINSSYSNKTLEEFYNQFTTNYYFHMAKYHQQKTLIYIGGTAVLSGGIYATAYYTKRT